MIRFLCLVGLVCAQSTNAFSVVRPQLTHKAPVRKNSPSPLFATSSSEDTSATDDGPQGAKLDKFLTSKYPSFYKLINDDMRKAWAEEPVTIFAPNDAAFENLGETKLAQIDDPRNDEIRTKMGSYHILVGSSISAVELRTEDWTKGRPKDGSKPNTVISAIVSQSGEVPVGRRKSGDFFGFGGKEDGDIVIGPEANIVQSFQVEGCFVHEVDSLVSPVVLWRYCDQLRIPGF